MTEYLFLYGTLLPGFAPGPLKELTARLRRIGAGTVPGRLYDLGSFPGAVFDSVADTKVLGEVFELPDDPTVLAKLDGYEGFDPHSKGSLFRRVQQPVTLPDGRQLWCWAYAYNRTPGQAPLIAGGDYAKWREAKH